MRTRRLSVLAVVLTVSISVLTACGSVEEKAVEAIVKNSDSSVKDVDIDGDGVSIETDEGKMQFGDGAKVPEEFPSDLPLPAADHTVLSASVMNGDIGLMLSVPELDVAEESARILAALEDAGWTIGDKSEMSSGETKMYILTADKDGLEAGVTLVRDGDEDGSMMYSVSSKE